MSSCMVLWCKNKGQIPGISYFRLTKSRHDAWMEALGRNPNMENLSRSNVVCSDHFTEENKICTNKCVRLKADAVPTLKLKKCDGLVENQWYLNRCLKPIVDMDLEEPKLEPFLDQDVKEIKDEYSLSDFKVEERGEDESENFEEKSKINLDSNEESGEFKFHVKDEIVDDIEHERSPEKIVDMKFDEIKLESSLGQAYMEVIDMDEFENKEGKPTVNLNVADIQNQSINGTIAEDGECKFHVDVIKHESEEQCLIIKNEEEVPDVLDFLDINEPDVDICSECTVIVAVNNNPVLKGTADRAAQTVPKGTLELRFSEAQVLGVYALRHLEEGVQLGPYKGHTFKVESTTGYSWRLSGGRLLDTSDETSSNYLRYINYAKTIAEQNLVAFQSNGELYYQICRDIEKGEELLIYLVDNLDQAYFEPEQKNLDEEYYKCQFCQLVLQFEEHRDRHQTFCKMRSNASYVGSLCKHFSVSTAPKIEDEESQKKLVESTTYYATNEKSFMTRDTSDNYKQKTMITCTGCSYRTFWKSHMSRHKEIHQQKNIPENLLKCIDCTFETCSSYALKKHRAAVHIHKNPFKCPDCKYESYFKSQFTYHRLRHNPRKEFKCAQCNFKTYYKRTFINHQAGHDQKNVFKCIQCDYKTYFKYNLGKHKVKHDQKNVLKCESCNFETYCKYSLGRHKLKHDQTNVLKCAHCDYETCYKQDLNRHSVKHEKNLLKCAHCDYESCSKLSLSQHIASHDEKNAFKCADCTYQTFWKPYMNRHKLQHQQKNLQTDMFTCTDGSRELIRNQEKPFKCTDCDYVTSNRKYLYMHRGRHDQKKIKCEDCDYVTYWKSNLNKHKLRRHVQQNVIKL